MTTVFGAGESSPGARRPLPDLSPTLHAAKEATADREDWLLYRGGETCGYHPLPYCEPGWVRYHGHYVWLADHVFDLRASSAYLARRRGMTQPWRDKKSFQAAFSRAVRTLLKRGALRAPPLVPIRQYDKDKSRSLVHYLADGLYLSQRTEWPRFVVLSTQGSPAKDTSEEAPGTS